MRRNTVPNIRTRGVEDKLDDDLANDLELFTTFNISALYPDYKNNL